MLATLPSYAADGVYDKRNVYDALNEHIPEVQILIPLSKLYYPFPADFQIPRPSQPGGHPWRLPQLRLEAAL